MGDIRTRFAPSPTGYIHVGNIRTALFAWLLARSQGGQFILRIEDTDKKREVEGSIEHIIACLNGLGLAYDEGPDKPGPHGPYLQSERLDIYRTWGDKLISLGRAYADPYSSAELNRLRSEDQAKKQPFLYRNHRPKNTPKWEYEKLPLRFKSDPKGYSWKDEIMGELTAGKEAVDDFVLIKSDGFPTYNFAHIVDDYEMKISHILRGQEFVASTPNYLNLYEALEINHPLFATPPPVLGPTGNKKLSKRDGAKDILEYLREGFLEEALINFIASLGWNDGTTKEIFNRNELIKSFSLDRVQRSGARFDEKRLLWLNGKLIRSLEINELSQLAKPYWRKEALDFPEEYRRRVLSLIQERLKYLAELPDLSSFFFTETAINIDLIKDNQKLAKLGQKQLRQLLELSKKSLEESDFSLADLQQRLDSLLDITNQSPAILLSLIRIATTQAPASPPLAESLALLGKETSLKRLDQQIEVLSVPW